MVASKVEIITKSYKDEPAAHWICDGSPELTLEPSDKATRGTEVVLHIAEDSLEFLEDYKIKEVLNRYNKFMPIPIKFGTRTEKIEQKKGEFVESENKDEIFTEIEVDNIQQPESGLDETTNGIV